MQKNHKPTCNPSDLSLLTPSKSSRLQAMRDKTATAETVDHEHSATAATLPISPELVQARRAIDQRLMEIMARLPPGKQRRLFKIRYGVEPDQIKTLPLKNVLKLLEIALPGNQNPATLLKLFGDLNYNGELA